MNPQKLGNFSGSGPEVVEKQESRQSVSGAKSSLVDSAEWDERCPWTSVRRRGMKDPRFCQSREIGV